MTQLIGINLLRVRYAQQALEDQPPAKKAAKDDLALKNTYKAHNIPAIKRQIRAGAFLRGVDGLKATWLNLACKAHDIASISSVFDQITDFNPEDEWGRTPLDGLFLQYTPQPQDLAIYHMLSEKGAKTKIASTKFLANVFGIGGPMHLNAQELYDGHFSYYVALQLAKYSKAFLREISQTNGIADLSPIMDAVPDHFFTDPTVLLKEIQEGKTLAFLTGWHTHRIGLIFAQKNILIQCNRGYGSNDLPGLIFFRIINTDKIQEALEKIKTCNSKNFYLKKIYKLLGLQALYTVGQKKQKVGNCTVANGAKGLVFGCLLLEYAKKHESFYSLQALSEARVAYKTWSRHLRAQTLLDYLDTPNPSFLDMHLFNLALEKANRKWP